MMARLKAANKNQEGIKKKTESTCEAIELQTDKANKHSTHSHSFPRDQRQTEVDHTLRFPIHSKRICSTSGRAQPWPIHDE